MNDLEGRIRQVLQEDASRAPLVVRMPEHVRRRVRRRQAATTVIASMAAIAVIAGAVVAIRDLDRTRTAPAHRPPQPSAWSPLREGSSLTHAGRTWDDPLDAPVDWVDITRVRFSYDFREPRWDIDLAAKPPPTRRLEPGVLIAYGVVLDTNGDGVADYLIGLDNDANGLGGTSKEPDGRGDYHAWVTDLATGETADQFGPSYGYPIDFVHPDEHRRPSPVIFFFLPGSAPADLDPKTVRFYAWASETRQGEVVAWDYGPDEGWVGP